MISISIRFITLPSTETWQTTPRETRRPRSRRYRLARTRDTTDFCSLSVGTGLSRSSPLRLIRSCVRSLSSHSNTLDDVAHSERVGAQSSAKNPDWLSTRGPRNCNMIRSLNKKKSPHTESDESVLKGCQRKKTDLLRLI